MTATDPSLGRECRDELAAKLISGGDVCRGDVAGNASAGEEWFEGLDPADVRRPQSANRPTTGNWATPSAPWTTEDDFR